MPIRGLSKQKRVVRGQSLVEIVVIVGVVVLLVTGLIVAATSTLRFGQRSKSRSQATNLAREAIELVRVERDADWELFFSRVGPYCLSETQVWTQESECPMTIQNQFSRTVTFEQSGDSISVEVKVEWWESLTKREVLLETAFTDWKTS